MKRKSFKALILIVVMSVCVSMFSVPVSAKMVSDDGDRAVAFVIATDIGLQTFATRHYYRYSETYTTQGSVAGGQIEFTKHSTAS